MFVPICQSRYCSHAALYPKGEMIADFCVVFLIPRPVLTQFSRTPGVQTILMLFPPHYWWEVCVFFCLFDLSDSVKTFLFSIQPIYIHQKQSTQKVRSYLYSHSISLDPFSKLANHQNDKRDGLVCESIDNGPLHSPRQLLHVLCGTFSFIMNWSSTCPI